MSGFYDRHGKRPRGASVGHWLKQIGGAAMHFFGIRSEMGMALAMFFLWLILVTGEPDLIDGLIYWLTNGSLK